MRFLSSWMCIGIVLVLSICSDAVAQTDDQFLKIMFREIGHKFLIQQDDSTSRVLPIEVEGDRYVVSFERQFEFAPDALLYAVTQVLSERKWDGELIVEVQKCGTDEVIHSFIAQSSVDDIACRGRILPDDCYTFYFTPILEAKLTTNSRESSFSTGILLGIILLAGAAVFWLVNSKKNKKAELIKIGKYQFDRKGMLLLLRAETLELSSTESDLLFLLYSNENITLERDYILNQVWGDAGSYEGRTLDVFISKLRKKLNSDPNVKIVNIRGVGYRLVIN